MGMFLSPMFLWTLVWENMKKTISSPNSLKVLNPFFHNGDLLCCMRHVYLLQWKNFKMMLVIVSNIVLVGEVLLTFSAEVGRIN